MARRTRATRSWRNCSVSTSTGGLNSQRRRLCETGCCGQVVMCRYIESSLPDGVGFVRGTAPRRQVIVKVEICTNQPTGPSGQECSSPDLDGFSESSRVAPPRGFLIQGECPKPGRQIVKAGRS